MDNNSLPLSFVFSCPTHNKKKPCFVNYHSIVLFSYLQNCYNVLVEVICAFQKNNDMEVKHAVHTTLQWVCFTSSCVEPIHYAPLHNIFFYPISTSHLNYMDQVIANASYSIDELEFLLNWVSHGFQPLSMLEKVCIVSTYKGWNRKMQ